MGLLQRQNCECCDQRRCNNHAFQENPRLSSISVPHGVVSIGDYAFYYSTALNNVTLPMSLVSIGSNCFGHCENLQIISIPSSVKEIGSYAFSHCRSLTSFFIPANVTSIGVGPFSRCVGLKAIDVDEFNPRFRSHDGVLFDDDENSLIHYPSGKKGKKYRIPDYVISIGTYAFSGCIELTSIHIPSSAASIGVESFSECINLESVVIPSSVLSVGEHAFEGCQNLCSVSYLGVNRTSCSNNVFESCHSLTTVCVPTNYVDDSFCGKNVT